MSLRGKRIVITRATHQSAELGALVAQRGALPVLYPCIRFEDATTPELDEALLNPKHYQWLIVTSANTASVLARMLTRLGVDGGGWSGKIAVIGAKTAEKVVELFGVAPSFVSPSAHGASLAEHLPLDGNGTILLPQSDLADDDLSDALRQRGATVDALTAYQTVMADGGEDVPMMLEHGQIDALTFTSPSNVVNFGKRIAPLTAYHIPVGVIGTTTAQASREFGYQTILTPAQFTLERMLNELETYFARKKS